VARLLCIVGVPVVEMTSNGTKPSDTVSNESIGGVLQNQVAKLDGPANSAKLYLVGG
jgi:hypothetical protein